MFWELLRESVLVQGFVTISFVLAFIYMACTGMAVPDVFTNILLVVVGYWFGTYTQKAAQSTMRLFLSSNNQEDNK